MPEEERTTIPASLSVLCPHCGERIAAGLRLPAVKPRIARTIQRILEDSELVFEVEQEEQGWGHWSHWTGQGYG
jgi:hypothetical protein